jgi:Fe-S-cluster-containing hydrogenase component 2
MQVFLKKAVKCDLCGGDPNCAKVCSQGAIEYKEGTTANIKRKKAIADKFKDLFGEVEE